MTGRIILNGRVLGFPLTGVQRYVSELASRLSDKIEIIRPKSTLRGFSGHLWEQVWLPRKISSNDVLWNPANTGSLSIANQVITIHDIGVMDHPEWYSYSFRTWYRFLLPILANKVKGIITVSEFSKSRIIDALNITPEKVTVIPNGVGDNFYPRGQSEVDRIAEKYSLPDQYIFSIGTVQPRKNLKRLVRAWKRVRVIYPDVALVVAGEEDRIFSQVYFDRPADGVLFLGRVAEGDLPALYTGARLFVYPSLYEGFGLPVLEAMACGVPVIASRGGAFMESVGEAGVLINSEDVEDITDNIQMLLKDSDKREALKILGIAHVKKYSWDQIAEKTWHFLSSILEEVT